MCIFIYIYALFTLYIYIYTYTHDIPGSTALGGSGSFKDRKAIGEVRCCDGSKSGWRQSNVVQ